MRKLYLITLISLAILLLSCENKDKSSFSTEKGSKEKSKSISVQGFIVRAESFAETIEVPGSIIANESVEIHPEMSGRIVFLQLPEGKVVEQGALLAKIYDGDIRAQLIKTETQLLLAQKTEERQAQLLKVQGISQQDYDLGLLQVNSLKADIEIIKTQLAKTEIKAPFSGRIGLKNISIGAYVTPSTIITQLNQTTVFKVDFSVPEKYVSRIHIGQTITLLTAGNSKHLIGKIIAIAPSILENSRSLLVRAQLNKSTAPVLPGSFAKISINFDPDPGAKMIPAQAILPQARGKKVVLYKNGTAVFQDVITGVRNADKIQVIDGVNIGDTVLVTGLMSIRPDSKITIQKIITPQP
ncbi:MAG: efflux RND transporter periplasmic adaptor subunit [Bacteroidetes bacterium]|nr:efflux RND transporter periplasmic adaptor subunit [Bacteroidota bacterium]